MTLEKFCLRWNDFETNISDAFRELREEKDFFDVTLACDDNQIEAHKVIVSACSPFFRNVLRRNPHQHPLIYLKGVKYKELLSVLNFMYMGEVNVAQDELNTFLAVAEDLKVKGLTQNNSENSGNNISAKQEDVNPETSYKEQNVRKTFPPPKRVRTIPTVVKPDHSVEDDDEIQEVVPVKSEPTEHTAGVGGGHPVHGHPTPAAHVRYQPAEDQHEEDQVEDDQGTVALDDTYAGDEGYDYHYDDGYDNTNTVTTAGSIGPEAGHPGQYIFTHLYFVRICGFSGIYKNIL